MSSARGEGFRENPSPEGALIYLTHQALEISSLHLPTPGTEGVAEGRGGRSSPKLILCSNLSTSPGSLSSPSPPVPAACPSNAEMDRS